MALAFLPFQLEGNAFLIETSRVREILGAQPLTRIPHATERLPGVFAHKGLAIPVIDLAAVLNLPALAKNQDSAPGDRLRTIVIRIGDDVAALAADEVWEVAHLEPEDLKEARVTLHAFAQAEVKWSEQVATLLDVEAMMQACMAGGSGP